MKKKFLTMLTVLILVLSSTACSAASSDGTSTDNNSITQEHEVKIQLSDDEITVDGAIASTDAAAAVYTGAEIVYYEEGRGESYGEGTDADAHTAEEADAHTVVTITQPGVYRVSGVLSAGQLAVDLGENAATNPEAVVTLILDGADITCTVAPAVIFYNVYECGSTDVDTATAAVDTTAAGANVILADDSVNTINGSYVARIYKEGTTSKLHKYDGAFYSKMSMNIDGETKGNGELHITAENEGLDSELHLTIHCGNISITSQNDGINTNEDGVSVTTINGGVLSINAGLGAEGDGIDSNGFLVINGGEITSIANGKSGDGGLDADKDILLNGGTVIALGSRNDTISTDSAQLYLDLSFARTQQTDDTVTILDPDGNTILDVTAPKEFQSLVFSSPLLSLETDYTVYVNEVQQQYTGTGAMRGGPGGNGLPRGEHGTEPPERPEGRTGEAEALPDGRTDDPKPLENDMGGTPKGSPSEKGPQGPGQEPPDGMDAGDAPGSIPQEEKASGEASSLFTLTETTSQFSGITALQ